MATIIGTDGQNIFWNDEVQGLQITPINAVSVPNFNSLVNQPAVYAQTFGVQANTRWVTDGVIVSNSETVTSNTINFTQADIGRTIYTVFPSTGQTKLIGTIISVQSTSQATVSALANATQSNCTLCVGTDDTAALQAAWTAALAIGGSVILPAGNMLVSEQLFYFQSNAAASQGAANGVIGQGSQTGGSTFVVSPGFNFSSVQSSGIIFNYDGNNGLGFTPFQGGFAKQFSVTGLGSIFSGGTTGLSLFFGSGGVVFSDIFIYAFSGPGPLTGVTLGTECRAYNLNIQPQYGVNGPAGKVHGVGLVNGATSVDIYSPIVAYSAGWGIEFDNNAGVNIFGGLFTSLGSSPGSDPHTAINVISSTDINFFGTYFNVNATGGSTPGGIYVDGSSSVSLDGVKFNNPVNSTACIWVASGGTLYAKGVICNASNSAAGINIAGTLYDLGGNSFGQSPTITGSVFGTNSITGLKAAASNITPGTGWGTTGAAGNGVSSVSGSTKLIQFTITATGIPGSNPTIAITFPTAFLVTPICRLAQVGGTNFTDVTNPTITSGPSVSGVTLTLSGTPTAGSTYIFQFMADLP